MNYNIELNDLLVFEDEFGNTYQDCVKEINGTDIFCNIFDYYKLTDEDEEPTVHCDMIKYYYRRKLKLKEIWHRADEDTYNKVWSK